MSFEIKSFEHDSFAFGDNRCAALDSGDGSPKACLDQLVAVTEDLSALFDSHPDIDAEEPWFGWAFVAADGTVTHEAELYPAAASQPELRPAIATYVERVIAWFVDSGGEPGFYVNEEEEAGSRAVEALVAADPATYLPLYLKFLEAIDLEHTCEQHSVVRRLADQLSDEQRQMIRDTLGRLSGGEYFPSF